MLVHEPVRDYRMNLLQKWTLEKPLLPKGRLSRWQEFRDNFGANKFSYNYAVEDAKATFLWYGERSKSRWKDLFSSERKGRRKEESCFCLACGRKTPINTICERCLTREEIRIMSIHTHEFPPKIIPFAAERAV